MRRTGRRVLLALALAIPCLATVSSLPHPAGAAPVEIQILTINDFHGRLQPPVTDPTEVGGAARLAGIVDELRMDGPTSFVSAGDNIGASTFVSAIDQDNPTIDVLGAAGLDASAVGNHEFDKGRLDLTDRVIPRAQFPYLGANVYFEGNRLLEPYEVVDVGGIDVGYVGVVTQETGEIVAADGIVGVTFTDPVAEAEAVAAELKDGNDANGEADVVVLLTHEGPAPENIDSVAELSADPVFGDFVDMSADVDAIVAGHTHLPFAFTAPVPGDPSRQRPVVMAEEYGKKLGQIRLTVDDATGDISAASAALIDVVGDASNAEVAQLVEQAEANAEVLGAQPVGSITGDILRGGTPPGSDRGVESVLGNFIADVQLDQTRAENRGGAQIALMNPGGLRDDLLYEEDGVITYSEAFAAQSFQNDVVTKTYTGAQIEQILEEQWQPASASRPVLWLGVSEGFTYTYNPDAPKGYRINPGSMMLDGQPIDPAGSYRVTANAFLAAGQDNFATFAEGTDTFATGENDLTMLISYLEENSPVTADPEPRSFVAVPADPDLTPFATVHQAVDQQLADFDHDATPAEREAWAVGIYTGTRTLEQMVIELQAVDLRSPEAALNRLYLAVFRRPADAPGLAHWTAELDEGRSLLSIAAFFTRSAEFRQVYGELDDGEFVDLLYENILGRAPSNTDRQYWVGQTATRGRAWVLLRFSESAENVRRTTQDLKVIDLSTRMILRPPTAGEHRVIMMALKDGMGSLTDLVSMIRHSDPYAARFTDPM